MSLLEDVFLQDEADEAQVLERIIDGDDLENVPCYEEDDDDDSPKEDEAEEDKRRVDPSQAKPKKVVKNPRFTLNPARLTGPRGIQVIPDYFKDFKFKGKGHEKEDLDLVLKKLEHWAYRLYPKFKFEDCLKKIETLGKKRPVTVHLHKIRSDQFNSEETVVQDDSSDEDIEPVVQQEDDEFDKLLQQQIEIARSTPAPNSAKKPVPNTPRENGTTMLLSKPTSSPSISDTQRERMLQNRKLAEERRLARMRQSNASGKETSSMNNSKVDSIREEIEQPSFEITENLVEDNEYMTNNKRRTNRSVISSSDEECEVNAVNQSVTIDVHKFTHNREKSPQQKGDTKLQENNNKLVENNTEVDDIEMVEIIDKNEGNKDKFEGNIEDEEIITDEERLARMRQSNASAKETSSTNNSTVDTIQEEIEQSNLETTKNLENDDEYITNRKSNRSVLSSSDEEFEINAVNQTVTIDVHKFTPDREKSPQQNSDTELQDANEVVENNTEVDDIEMVEMIDEGNKDKSQRNIEDKEIITNLEIIANVNKGNMTCNNDDNACDVNTV